MELETSGSPIIFAIAIIIFMALLGWALINNLNNYLKSRKYQKIKARGILTTEEYSDEWAKYFPEEAEKAQKLKEKLEGIIGKANNNLEEDIDGNNVKTLIAEYVVDGKKYYYNEKFVVQNGGDTDPLKNYVGKDIEIYYNPDNPKENVRKSSSIKTVFVVLLVELVLFALLMLVLNTSV